MNINKRQLLKIIAIVGGILVVYLCYWNFLVPQLKVHDNDSFRSLSEFGGGRINCPEYRSHFLVVAVKVNHWPGPLMSKDFELEYYRFPSNIKVECFAMNTLPIFTHKAGRDGAWGQEVTLVKKDKFPKLVFIIPESVSEATLTYLGKRVGKFTINRKSLV